VLVRFKELDSELRRYNHRSERQDGLDFHEFSTDDYEQLTLDGAEGNPTMLTCGYVPVGDGVSISRIVVVCHLGRSAYWHYDLERGSTQQVLTLPGIGEPPRSIVRSRIRKESPEAEAE
jgi:hypothetical protein